MRAWALLVAATLLVPLARAGDEANPDVTDGASARIQDGSLDFLAAWLEASPSGVAFTIKVREASAPLANHGWGIGFELGGTRHVVLVVADAKGALHSCACTAGHIGQTADDMPDDLASVSFTAGKPAYIRGVAPYGSVPGLQPGAVLQNVGAASLTYASASGWNDYDGNSALEGYHVERALVPAWVARAAPYVAGGIVLVALGAAGAFFALRKRGSSAPHPPAPPPQPPAPPAPGKLNLQPPPR